MKKVKKILLFIESDRISGLFNVRQDISKLRKYFKTDIKEDGRQVTIKVTVLQDLNIRKAYIKFILEGKISLVRDTSYKWEKLKIKHIFPSICNKIIKLKDKTLATGTVPTSVWEVGGFGRNTIIDHLINPLITPVFHLQDNFRDFQKQFLIKKNKIFESGLIFSSRTVEWSRSSSSFSPIVIITDHCDFDTAEKLSLIREILRNYNIKVTKGFFTAESADQLVGNKINYIKEELGRWRDDLHELAFHTHLKVLSESINIDNFGQKLRKAPFKTNIWIDHGMTKYNFSMQPNGISKYQWIRKIKSLGFDFVWNYVDTYDARFDCLSQIHPRNMTLSYRLRSMVQNNRFFSRKRLMFRLRNYLRFNGDEKTAALGFELSRMIKYHQNINLLNIYKITIDLVISFIKITLLSHRIPILSKFAPTLFYLPGDDKSIKFFQTMTIRDFEEAFEPKSLKKFISNNGFIIAHTYMSYTGHQHTGRIILEYDDNIKLNENSIKGLKYLGKMIASGKVSNPTLGEYSSYFSEIAKSKIVNSDKGPKIIGGKVTYRAIR